MCNETPYVKFGKIGISNSLYKENTCLHLISCKGERYAKIEDTLIFTNV